jgi:hypothetical protein
LSCEQIKRVNQNAIEATSIFQESAIALRRNSPEYSQGPRSRKTSSRKANNASGSQVIASSAGSIIAKEGYRAKNSTYSSEVFG